MVKKTCENVDLKRELLYSFSTLVFIPITHYFAVTSVFSPLTPENRSAESSTLPHHEVDDLGESHTTGGDSSSEPLQTGEKAVNGCATPNELIVDYVLQHRELPFETMLYLLLFELLKLFIVFTVYPGSHLFDQTPGLRSMWHLTNLTGADGGGGGEGLMGSSGGRSRGGHVGGKFSQQGRLPFSKRDRESSTVKSPSLQIKLLELWKGLCNYIIGCFICHLFVILLGGPILENFKITFQFCVILITLSLSPVCLAVQPSRLLEEIMYISLWNSENEILYRTKWRFTATIVGGWIGAVVIPLDWDRPWQKWPIPCLTSTLLTFLVSNVVMTIHLFCINFGIYHKMSLISTESNKVKNF